MKKTYVSLILRWRWKPLTSLSSSRKMLVLRIQNWTRRKKRWRRRKSNARINRILKQIFFTISAAPSSIVRVSRFDRGMRWFIISLPFCNPRLLFNSFKPKSIVDHLTLAYTWICFFRTNDWCGWWYCVEEKQVRWTSIKCWWMRCTIRCCYVGKYFQSTIASWSGRKDRCFGWDEARRTQKDHGKSLRFAETFIPSQSGELFRALIFLFPVVRFWMNGLMLSER